MQAPRERVRVLLIDDDRLARSLIESYLDESHSPMELVWKPTWDEGLAALLANDCDVCLLDYSLGDRSGLELLREASAKGARGPVVMLTSEQGREVYLEAARLGAVDYLVKGEFGAAVLERVLRYALERARTLQSLRESEERYQLAAHGSNDGIWDWAVDSETIFLSPRWRAIIGLEASAEGTLWSSWFTRVHPDDLQRLRDELDKHVKGELTQFENEHRLLHKDGTWRWVLARGTAVRGPDGRATRVAGSLTDVTQARSRDPLSGLPNRLLFLDRLERAFVRRRKSNSVFAVLFLDLDRFKLVNDSLGHDAGDELLVEVSRRLEKCVRGADTVARLGGDEFTFLLEDVQTAEGATRVARRILEALASPVPLRGREVYVSASIGIALLDQRYHRPEELVRDADAAMYRAKESGRGRYVIFDEAMHARAAEQLRMETELRRALEGDEFEVHYQPVLSMDGRVVKGFEALVRWRHAEGLRSPDKFIPMAEETGLVVQLDRLVLKAACTQVRRWHAAFPRTPPFFISVNASRKNLALGDWPEVVASVLKETGFPPALLCLELTEASISDNAAHVTDQLERLRAQGVQLVMDDFGTGYSSLGFLHHLPFTGLKVDRSFVSRLGEGPQALEMVTAIVSLARGLKLEVTAEGVETEAQRVELEKLRCELAQGYMFARPAPASAVELLLAKPQPS